MAEKYWYGGDGVYKGQADWDTSRFATTLDNAAATDETGGLVGIPCTGHGFLTGDSVTIAGSTNYNDTYEVHANTTADKIVITETYAAETFGGSETVTSAETESNWRLCSDDSETTKPADADVVYCDRRAALNSTTNKRQSMDSHCAGSYSGTPDLAGLNIRSTFDGDIGSADYPWEFEADGFDVIVEGTGTYYFMLSSGTGTDADCDRFVINNKLATVYLSSLENDGANVGLWALVIGLAGTLYLSDDCAVTTIKVLSNDVTVYSGTGVYNDLSTTALTILMVGGTMYHDSAILAAEIYGGSTFYWGTEIAAAVAGLDAGLIQLTADSRVYWRCMDSTKSILEQFIAYGGTLDASQPINSDYAREIGDGAKDSEIWTEATVRLNAPGQAVTLASGSKIIGRGGKLYPPDGEELAW